MQNHNCARSATVQLLAFLFVLLVACASLLGIAGPKDPPWIAKNWTTWNSWDCEAVLNASPWVRVEKYLGEPKQNAEMVYGNFVIRLRSALPIRQALFRQEQLKAHFDSMDIQKKSTFNQIHKMESAGPDGNTIVLEVGDTTEEPLPQEGRRDIVRGPWPLRQVALKLWDGATVTPTRMVLLKNELFSNLAEYDFPREIHGKPIFGPNDHTIWIAQGLVLTFPKGKLPMTLNQNEFKIPKPPSSFSDPWHVFQISNLTYLGKTEY